MEQPATSGPIALKPGADGRLRPLEVGRDEILLRDDLLDKQVVDTSGAKIERVNDVHLLIVNSDLRVVHVDFGARGILRRLGWLRPSTGSTDWLFAYRIEEKMISWKYVQPLSADPARAISSSTSPPASSTSSTPRTWPTSSRSSTGQPVLASSGPWTCRRPPRPWRRSTTPSCRLALIETAPAERASDILEEMAPDEATDLLADLPEEKKRHAHRGPWRSPRGEAVEDLLQFKEGTAGSIMTKDFFAVGRGRDDRRGRSRSSARRPIPWRSVAYIYVTDADGRLVGVCTLRHLLICDRDDALGTLMNPHLITVETDENVDDGGRALHASTSSWPSRRGRRAASSRASSPCRTSCRTELEE